jgi:hypothetical protein
MHGKNERPPRDYGGVGIPEHEEPRQKEEAPRQRRWYRRLSDGQLAWLVTDEDEDDSVWDRDEEFFPHMRLDRASECIRIRVPLNADGDVPPLINGWNKATERRPLTRGQVAQIVFDADRRLCFFFGVTDASRREWVSLSEQQRMEWTRKGPKSGLRKKLWESIFEVFKDEL